MTFDINKAWDFVVHLTYKRLFITAIAGALAIGGYTVFENRQSVYDNLGVANIKGSYEVREPGPEGKLIIENFMKKYPTIGVVAIVQADPIKNTRKGVYRAYSDTKLKQLFEEEQERNPTAGEGALFTSNPESNKQVIAVMNGEFYCAPLKGSFVVGQFPGVEQTVQYSCRVPLPPYFQKAGGWFSLHLKKWPEERIDELKFDALTMSVQYFNAEIAPKGQSVMQ